ncbi:MAG: addiction module protein [Polyangiaceae bacterium]
MAPPPAEGSGSPMDDDDEEPADPDWDEAWDAELTRRIADVNEGRVECLTLEETMAGVDAALSEVRRNRCLVGEREARVRLIPWEETQAKARAILEAARSRR